MANRRLARADDNPGEILEDGELHKVGMWDAITIERSAAGAPGLMFVMTRYENSMMFDQMTVTVEDGAAFLAPVNAWLNGNDPEPYRWSIFRNADGDPAGYDFDAVFQFDPRPNYNQNREDYS